MANPLYNELNNLKEDFNEKLETAMRRYKLEGLPDTCSERVILQSLIFNGKVAFYEDNGAIFAMQASVSGKGVNINGDPVNAYVFSKNGIINKEIDLFIKGADNSALLNHKSLIWKVSIN